MTTVLTESPRPTTSSPADNAKMPTDGNSRVIVESVTPEIDAGRFPIKRAIGERVVVEADVFADGHDSISCRLLYRREQENDWHAVSMSPLGNDRWRAEFTVSSVGRYCYTVEGWIDRFKTWQSDFRRRVKAAQNLDLEFLIGAQLVEEAAQRAGGDDASRLFAWSESLRSPAGGGDREALALSEDLLDAVQRYPDRRLASRYTRELPVVVDRKKAQFSSWYEIFPRSCSPQPGRHGTLRDCQESLPYIASMGFDVVYLPPVHPIGSTFRKGKNNSPAADPGDVGSPWAIGSEAGGHKSIHPDLGTLEDFRALVAAAGNHGLEIALDIAFQCTPDHPWAREHPEWFRKRPDGSIQYAENPPKKYQDIYPLDFESAEWRAIWEELRSVFLFWIEQGVRIFRVDNPHTKSFAFWEWVIGQIKDPYPEVIFLAEAFTRPRAMYRLAKLGFSQSYTYFTWRNTKQELTAYFTEINHTEVAEYFRANLWPNTPDILPEALQVGARPAFMVRLVLAATLGANYGIYGPAFELVENTPREPGSEEYLNSEKYELKHWDRDSPQSLRDFIARINRIRHDNPAFESDRRLIFHETDNPNLICYSKMTDDGSNIVIMVVNLDWSHTQAGWVTLNVEALGLEPNRTFEAQDLLSGGRYVWQSPRDYVELTPQSLPAHIFKVRRWMKTERDFDYYL
jgi:starch synthase (maltosyl-transferring)